MTRADPAVATSAITVSDTRGLAPSGAGAAEPSANRLRASAPTRISSHRARDRGVNAGPLSEDYRS